MAEEITSIIKDLISVLIDLLEKEKIKRVMEIIKEIDKTIVSLSTEVDILIKGKEELQQKNFELTQTLLSYETNGAYGDDSLVSKFNVDNTRKKKENLCLFQQNSEYNTDKKRKTLKFDEFLENFRNKNNRRKNSKKNEYIKNLQDENLKLKGMIMDFEVAFVKLNSRLDDVLILAGFD